MEITPHDAIPLLKPVIDLSSSILKVAAQKAWSWAGEATEQIQFKLFGGFSDYLKKSYEQNSFFTSIIFKNEQKRLDDYYIPLTLVNYSNNNELKVSSFPKNIIQEFRKILIVDSAGMGKSTISKFIFLTCVRELFGIPILIELRKLKSKDGILAYIIENLKDFDGEIQRSLLIKLIKEGKFLFIFDGFDEVSESDRQDIISQIQDFITNAPNNYYTITSREEASLAAFPEFQRFTIKPLDRNESYALLRRYDKEKGIAEDLINKIEETKNQSVAEFLTNPLLTSLLYKSYDFKHAIPLKKHIFYRQVFEALFETHDLMKDDYQRKKRTKLDIDQFSEVMRYFCFLSYKDEKYEYTKDELLKYFEKIKSITSQKELTSSDFIYDLTHGVPLLVEEGNYIRWSHRSMQEYFAALWVCFDSKEKQAENLRKLFLGVQRRHKNIILLCADIDPVFFRRTIIRDVIKKLTENFFDSYKNFSNISSDLIEERKALTAGQLPFIFHSTKKQTGSSIENKHEEVRSAVMHAAKEMDLSGFSFSGGPHYVGFINETDTLMLHDKEICGLFSFIKYSVPFTKPPYDLKKSNYGLVLIDDNSDNFTNSEKYFEEVNYLLKNAGCCRFDIKEAQKILKSINEEEEEHQQFGI